MAKPNSGQISPLLLAKTMGRYEYLIFYRVHHKQRIANSMFPDEAMEMFPCMPSVFFVKDQGQVIPKEDSFNMVYCKLMQIRQRLLKVPDLPRSIHMSQSYMHEIENSLFKAFYEVEREGNVRWMI